MSRKARIKGVDVVIRPMRPADDALVYDSWVESFRLAHAAGVIPMDMYRTIYREVVSRILALPTVAVAVLCMADDLDQVLGYLVHQSGSPPTLHYVFVKEPFRRAKVATLLASHAGIVTSQPFGYSFKTPAMSKLGWMGGKFNPLPIRRLTAKD